MKHILAIAVLLVAGCGGEAQRSGPTDYEIKQQAEWDKKPPNVVVVVWNGLEYIFDYDKERHGDSPQVTAVSFGVGDFPVFTAPDLMREEEGVLYVESLFTKGQCQNCIAPTFRVGGNCKIVPVKYTIEYRPRPLPPIGD